MKTDAYTKTLLTVIAFCLVCLTFKDFPLISSAQAQTQLGPTQVDIVAINGQTFGKIQVSSVFPSLPVQIQK